MSANGVSITEYRNKKNKKANNTLIAYSFILPNLIGFVIFTFMPIVFALILSFCEWNAGNSNIRFVGLQNYITMFTKDRSFPIALRNTIYYTVFTVPITLIVALLLAILMNKPIKGKVFFRSCFFFPYIASLVAVAVVWMAIFNPDKGPINQLLIRIGVTNPPRWAASQKWAMPTIIGLTVWKNMGYYMIVYLAGLQGVPRELYEAAQIDGAGRWKQFTNVIWPCITHTTFFVVMMLIITTFKSYDIMYITTQGGPGEATKVLAYHIYNSAFVSLKFGYASSVAMVLMLIVVVISIAEFKVERKFTEYL